MTFFLALLAVLFLLVLRANLLHTPVEGYTSAADEATNLEH